jgi:3D (Asp-Asp-Asp) domain-containing protein
MNASAEKVMKGVTILCIGWFLGYMHHFKSTQKTWEDIGTRIEVLGAEIAELREIVEPLKRAKKAYFKVTAYSNDPGSIDVSEWRDGLTATGATAKMGAVASDWLVLRPGTSLFVPGYGAGRVSDRGGLVKGNHIDVFMDSKEEARLWGVRRVEVFVIE